MKKIKRRRKFRKKSSKPKRRLSVFKWLTAILLVSLTALALYGWHLAVQVDRRFSARRWQIPSTVYADITLLYPGQRLNLPLFKKKLRALGYIAVSGRPQRKGQVRISKKVFEIFLHDLITPNRSRPGFLATIRISGNRIRAIEQTGRRNLLPLLELEPEELGQIYGSERQRRRLVSIRQVPQHLIRAVLAAEDSNYYHHFGFDPLGILRAIYVNLRHGHIRQGASTITQQLAKNYFLSPERSFRRKFNELLLAVVMEFMYAKDTLLEIYLNEIYLGQNGSVAVNGIGEAAAFYFGKPVEQLTLVESATIAGLIKAPNTYSPHVNIVRSKKRRDTVLRAMHANGWISRKVLEKALKSSVAAADFRPLLRKAPYFMDYLSRQLAALYAPEALASLGLSVYTTLDTQVQMAAEQALERGLSRLEARHNRLKRKDPKRRLQGAIIVMQPKTGYVLAMVGGRNYGISQYNRITQSRRQPGSAFKPFVYLAALDRFTPADRISNVPATYTVDGKNWRPQNYAKDNEPEVSVRTALSRSLNVATVDLAMKIGLERIVDRTVQFGFTTPIKAYPSLALGAFEVSPLELARAYCAFAADGVLPYPLSLKDVADENGQVLQRTHVNIEQVITPAEAFLITSMLQSVVSDGTARSLANWSIDFAVAGKTGTTNDFKDAWFVGYTPDMLALVWVGFDRGDSIFASGSASALPIWADLLSAIPHVRTGASFHRPEAVRQRTVCSDSGQLAVPGCPRPINEYFLAGNMPVKKCPLHHRKGKLEQILDAFKNLFK